MKNKFLLFVIPAKAQVQAFRTIQTPACAGVTKRKIVLYLLKDQ